MPPDLNSCVRFAGSSVQMAGHVKTILVLKLNNHLKKGTHRVHTQNAKYIGISELQFFLGYFLVQQYGVWLPMSIWLSMTISFDMLLGSWTSTRCNAI